MRVKRPSVRPFGLTRKPNVAVALAGSLALFGSASCSNSSASSADACQSTRTFFEQEVWSGFMSTTCTKCHLPDGVAVLQNNAKFVLQNSSYPGFIDANIANLTTVSQIEYSGTSELLLKPIGKANHGGGQVLQPDSPEYAALTKFVSMLSNTSSTTTCDDTTAAALKPVTLADGPTTLRKAAIDLAGRLPTTAETASVQAGTDASIDAALDKLMTEDIFFDRIREMFNDLLLTDEFLEYGGKMIDSMDGSFYPGLAPYKDQSNPAYASSIRPLINQALAREPLDLIAYVVKNGKPFTDVVSGNYTVVNPFSAIAYNATGVTFKNSMDYNEFYPAQITAGPAGSTVQIPHAGTISSPAFLFRWPTTPTNRSRARARRVFQFFLATDVLQISVRPVDQTTVASIDDPTENSKLCTVCHQVIDPVAGGFRNYEEDGNYEDFNPQATWHDDMFAPGYGAAQMTSSDYPHALQWLGGQVSQDPRFPISAVNTVFTGLTGQAPLTYPANSTDPNFASELSAWTAQDDFLRSTATTFASSGYDLRTIFKAVVKSAYYRGVTAPSTTDGNLLAQVGGARLLTPEMLNRKIPAVLGGYRWRAPYNWTSSYDWLLNDYNILYGGIDSDSTTTRLTSPNSVIAAVVTRMANESACAVTAWDFSKVATSRNLFPKVELTQVPQSAGADVPGSIAAIKANIQYLHQLILGETLDSDDPEIQRTYQLFFDTWNELNQAGSTSVIYECQAQNDPTTGNPLPKGTTISDDKNFTLRSWQAVIAYLLSDYKFIYE